MRFGYDEDGKNIQWGRRMFVYILNIYSNWDFIKTVWIRNKELQDKIILENIKKKLLNEGTRY